ncbi:MAG: hypothetical protein GY720_00085 [bacterium]|nr:hypothetical protein [bacterium]
MVGPALLLVVSSCESSPAPTTEALTTTTTTESPIPRVVRQKVAVGPNGLSEAMRIERPPAYRSMFEEVTGGAGDIVAIGSVRLTGGQELFDVASFGDVRLLLEVGIPHVELTLDDDTATADPFSDTDPENSNLRGNGPNGRTISEQQAAAMFAGPLIGR